MLGKITEKIEDFAENKIELLKVEAEEKISRVIVKAIQIVLFALFALLFVLFLSIGIAELLNEAIGNDWAGHLIVGGFYLAIFFVLFTLRNSKFFKEIDLIDL